MTSKLMQHQGHNIVIAKYESEEELLSTTIECADCYEILYEEDAEEINV